MRNRVVGPHFDREVAKREINCIVLYCHSLHVGCQNQVLEEGCV